MLLKESKGFCGLRVFSCVGSKIVALETRVAYSPPQAGESLTRSGFHDATVSLVYLVGLCAPLSMVPLKTLWEKVSMSV